MLAALNSVHSCFTVHILETTTLPKTLQHKNLWFRKTTGGNLVILQTQTHTIQENNVPVLIWGYEMHHHKIFTWHMFRLLNVDELLYRLSFLFRDLYSILSKQRVVFTRFVFLLAWLHGKILRKRFVTLSVVILLEHFAKSRWNVIWVLIVSLFVLLFYYYSSQMKV